MVQIQGKSVEILPVCVGMMLGRSKLNCSCGLKGTLKATTGAIAAALVLKAMENMDSVLSKVSEVVAADTDEAEMLTTCFCFSVHQRL